MAKLCKESMFTSALNALMGVQEVILDEELDKCLDKRLGISFHRGISGPGGNHPNSIGRNRCNLSVSSWAFSILCRQWVPCCQD